MDDRRHPVAAAAESRTAAATSGGTTVGMTRKAAAGGVIDVPGTVSRPVTLRVANGLLSGARTAATGPFVKIESVTTV